MLNIIELKKYFYFFIIKILFKQIDYLIVFNISILFSGGLATLFTTLKESIGATILYSKSSITLRL
jgi:hypothetical protein